MTDSPVALYLQPSHYRAVSMACHRDVDSGYAQIYAEPCSDGVILVATNKTLAVVARVRAMCTFLDPVLLDPLTKRVTRKEITALGTEASISDLPAGKSKLRQWRATLGRSFVLGAEDLQADSLNVTAVDSTLLETVSKIGKELGGRITFKAQSTKALVGSVEMGSIDGTETFLICLAPLALIHGADNTVSRLHTQWNNLAEIDF